MKPIRMKESLRVADKVRRAVSRLNVSSLLTRRGHFECFDNCREQGYVLKIFGDQFTTFCIAFSENRNSDDIVVYCYDRYHYPQNLPADNLVAWSDAKFFGLGQVEEAARYILERAVRFLCPPPKMPTRIELTMADLIETALKTYPKARKIAVENFCFTAPIDKAANGANLAMDAASYGWNRDTVMAISYVLKAKGLL